jgi:hypothetical protein
MIAVSDFLALWFNRQESSQIGRERGPNTPAA